MFGRMPMSVIGTCALPSLPQPRARMACARLLERVVVVLGLAAAAQCRTARASAVLSLTGAVLVSARAVSA